MGRLTPARVFSTGILRWVCHWIYSWIYGSKMVVLVLPGPRDEPFWGIKAARAGGRRGCGQRLAEGELGPVRSADPNAGAPQLRCARGRKLTEVLAFPPSEPVIADDKLDSEKTPEAVPPPGCRRPVDLPPTARVVMRVCATRSGEYEGVREGDDEDETRSLLPQAQSPFLDGSGPSTSPFPPLPLQPVRTGQRTGALRHRS